MKTTRITAAALIALTFVARPGLAKDDDTVLKGTVHNEDKKLVSGATVRLLHRADDGKLEEVDTTTTDEKGLFEFTKVHDGTFEIVVLSGKRSAQLRDRAEVTVAGKDKTDLDFTVRKGEEPADEKAVAKSDMNVAKVKGNARFAANDFVKDAKVRLLSGQGTDFSSMREIATTETDSKGNFMFPGIQQGDYTIVVTLGKSEGSKKITINPKEHGEVVDVLVK